MKLDRLTHSPDTVIDFYEDALTAVGALCERTWHDRLEVVAEGRSARLWNESGALHEVELWFSPPEGNTARDASREVFAGCPLTFRLAESIRPSQLELDRVILNDEGGRRAPTLEVAEKLWRAQFPETYRWQLASPFVADFHFSVVALIRSEIQAIDQHWSLRRVAISLPDGASDDSLAQNLHLAEVAAPGMAEVSWPKPEPARWREFLGTALEGDLAADLSAIKERQSLYLRRELDRVDDYFEHYEQELAVRATRTGTHSAKAKTAERLTAAKAEHTRRRADQLARHEIHVHAHLDTLLLIAEPAWRAQLRIEVAHQPQTVPALFVPRARRWVRMESVCESSATPMEKMIVGGDRQG